MVKSYNHFRLKFQILIHIDVSYKYSFEKQPSLNTFQKDANRKNSSHLIYFAFTNKSIILISKEMFRGKIINLVKIIFFNSII